MAAAAGRTGHGGRGPPAQGPSRSPAWVPARVAGGPGGGHRGLGAYGRRAGVLALADAGRVKRHSSYAMCGAGSALGARAANTVRTATRQDGHALDGSQRPERVGWERLPMRRVVGLVAKSKAREERQSPFFTFSVSSAILGQNYAGCRSTLPGLPFGFPFKLYFEFKYRLAEFP